MYKNTLYNYPSLLRYVHNPVDHIPFTDIKELKDTWILKLWEESGTLSFLFCFSIFKSRLFLIYPCRSWTTSRRYSFFYVTYSINHFITDETGILVLVPFLQTRMVKISRNMTWSQDRSRYSVLYFSVFLIFPSLFWEMSTVLIHLLGFLRIFI